MQALLIEAKDSPTILGILRSGTHIIDNHTVKIDSTGSVIFDRDDPTRDFCHRSTDVIEPVPVELTDCRLIPIRIPEVQDLPPQHPRKGTYNGQVEPIDPGYSSLDRANREAQLSQRVAYSDSSHTIVRRKPISIGYRITTQRFTP